MKRRPITHFVIHHSAGVAGNVREFDRIHRSRGFSQIGYHVVICNGNGGEDGEIQYGRPSSIDGAGVWGNNKHKLHVCLVGNFERGHSGYTGKPTDDQLNSLKVVLRDWAGKFQNQSGQRPGVVGHREIALADHGTACPGSDFPLREIRAWYTAMEGV